MTWRTGVTIILLLAALASGWSAWRKSPDAAPTAAGAPRPDYLLHDFELIALDKQGKQAFILRAPRLARSPGDQTMALQAPVFLLPDKAGLYWRVRSDTGWVSADNSEVRLRGDVVTTSPEEDASRVRMETGQLNVFPDTSRATSDDLVTITQPGSTMSGRGMQVDLASKRYSLLSQVKHRYVPSN